MQGITDRLRNYIMQKKLGVTFFSGVTAVDKKISPEHMADFYEKSLDVLFHHNLDQKVKSIIAHGACCFNRGMNADQQELQLAAEYLRGMDAKECPIPNWLGLSAFFMSNGFFQLSFIVREKYKERLLATSGRLYRWERILAYLENSEVASAQMEIQKLEQSKGMKQAYGSGISTARTFIRMLTEPREQIKNKRDLQEGDQAFYDFLKGKKLVIEGPAPEIEDIDFKGQVLYIRNNDFIDRDEKKTDITYLNYYAFKLYQAEPEKYRKQWKYVCLKKDIKQMLPTVHTRISKNPKEIFLRGHPNMLPLELYDLAGEDIFVTGNNLFVSADIHTREYDKGMDIHEQDTDIILCRDLGQHDVIAQYFFLKNLYDANVFEADSQLTYVLCLGAEKYCRIMDEVHGIARRRM